jgi:hypothetical protein
MVLSWYACWNLKIGPAPPTFDKRLFVVGFGCCTDSLVPEDGEEGNADQSTCSITKTETTVATTVSTSAPVAAIATCGVDVWCRASLIAVVLRPFPWLRYSRNLFAMDVTLLGEW